MANKIAVRTKWDRIRYMLTFEALLILMSAPTIAHVLERQTLDVGAMALVLSLKAMLINPVYNYLFDMLDVRAGRVPTERSPLARVAHAVGFESVLTLTSLPIVVWWLQVSWLQALMMDLAIISFIVVYTYIFTWLYDRIFPVVQPAREAVDEQQLSAA
ncbi:PACE efflux transporter [Marinobacterium arenosum]|uniref:PACE efflux transporter n=1 Tax=Marinobacterium arenosum TaxID=2862496 RepID=UPI001C9638A9|nr:PACE efflux transporter [Marinobacterium arenosum]MBY4675599.1 PACE efflux transporter [Marinobacterium arenosum]